MSTTVYLIRHAAHAIVDRVLVGRDQTVGLSHDGFRQAGQLAAYFSRRRIDRVHSSPQLRARQTALAIAAALSMPVVIAPDLNEIDAGEWTGRSFADLERDPRWRGWNEQRASTRIPNGESMSCVQNRVMRHLTRVAGACVNRRIVAVTHAEPIRAAILRFRGIPLAEFARVHVDPASVTVVALRSDGRGEVMTENQTIDMLVAA